MGSAWITLGLLSIITTWESAAITNRRPQHQLESAVRNFRHVDAYSSHHHVDWEVGLREAANQALLRERYQDYHLRDRLLEAPLIGRQEAPTPFGDIVILARGQLYAADEGHFIFVQDPYQNDCDDCHNARNRCRSSQCKLWKPHDNQHLLALWTVKRIRHRDYNNIHRYELEYTISPITHALNEQFLIRTGHYNYAIPGHVFVVKHHDLTTQPIDVYPTVVYKRRSPHHRFNPQVLIGVDSDGRKHFLHSYPGFYTSSPVHSTHIHHLPSTNDPEEVDLYKELIETLAAKTSTTQGGKNSPPMFLLNQFDNAKSTNKLHATKPLPTTPVKFPTSVHQETQETSSIVLFPTQPIKGSGNQNTQYSPEYSKDSSTSIHYFTPTGEEQLITDDQVKKMSIPVTSKGTTRVPSTQEIDGSDFLFPTVRKTTTHLKTTNKPTLSTNTDSVDFLFPDEQKRPAIQFATPKTTTDITTAYYNPTTSPGEEKTANIASSTPTSTTDNNTSESTRKYHKPTVSTTKYVDQKEKDVTLQQEESTTIPSNAVKSTTPQSTIHSTTTESTRKHYKSTTSTNYYVDQKEKDVILQQGGRNKTIPSGSIKVTTSKSTILNTATESTEKYKPTMSTSKTTETILFPQEEKSTRVSSSTANKLTTPKLAVDQITSKSTTKYYKSPDTKPTDSTDQEEKDFLSPKGEKDAAIQIPTTTMNPATIPKSTYMTTSRSSTEYYKSTSITSAHRKEEKTSARPSNKFTPPKLSGITKITTNPTTKYYRPMKSKSTKANTDEANFPSPKDTTTTTSSKTNYSPTEPVDDFLSIQEEKNHEIPLPSTKNQFTTSRTTDVGISISKSKSASNSKSTKQIIEEKDFTYPEKQKTTSIQLPTSKSTKKYFKPTESTDETGFPSSEEKSTPLYSTTTMPTTSKSTSTKYHKPTPNTKSTKPTTVENDLLSPKEEKPENTKSTTSKPYHKTTKMTESEEKGNTGIPSQETSLKFMASTPRSTTIGTTKRRLKTTRSTTTTPKSTTFKITTPASTRFIRPRPFTKTKSTTSTTRVAPQINSKMTPQPKTPIKFATTKSTTVKPTTIQKLPPSSTFTQTYIPTIPLLEEEAEDAEYSEITPTKAMTIKPLKTQPESIKNQLQPPNEDTDTTVPYTSPTATQKTEESTIAEVKTTEEINETTPMVTKTVVPTTDSNIVTKATEIPTWITETKVASADTTKATVNNNFTTIQQYMETDITSMDHILTTIKMNGTHYMQTTTFKATKPTYTTSGIKPPTTFDDFLRGNGKEPTHTNKDYNEDDIFGSQQIETTTETTTKVIKQSEVADELFVKKERSGKQFKTDTSTVRVIYSDFYEASTTPTPPGNTFQTTLQFTPPTSQSYVTSINFQVNGKNKTEIVDNETSTAATEVTTEYDGYITYKTESPTQLNEDTTNSVKHATKRAFDQAALQLVNHARTINYLSRSRNRTTKVKYKRRRTYTPKTRTSTRRKHEKIS